VNIGFAFKLAREHTLAKPRQHGVFDSECVCKADVYSELFSEIKVGVHTNGGNALLCKQIGNGRRRKPFYRGKNYGMMTDNQLTSQTFRLIHNIFRNVKSDKHTAYGCAFVAHNKPCVVKTHLSCTGRKFFKKIKYIVYGFHLKLSSRMRAVSAQTGLPLACFKSLRTQPSINLRCMELFFGSSP